jgi:hypothetical protein
VNFSFIRVPEHREPYTETWFERVVAICETRILGVASDEREVFRSPLKNLAVLCERTSLQGLGMRRMRPCGGNKTLLSSNSIAAKKSPLNFILISIFRVLSVKLHFSL